MLALLLAATLTGPSSSAPPYVLPIERGASTISILTAGDSVNFYRMAGAPDGLGAFDNGDGTFTVLMNHELGGTAGGVRAHGARGAFVSKWTIRKSDLAVVKGEDLIKQVALWNRATTAYDSPKAGVVLGNFCSATFDRGTNIFFSGEENDQGRVFAHLLDGTSYELARLGRARWENAVMHPTALKTVVVGLDDALGGFVYVYIGDKQSSGSVVERAGLTNGSLYVVRVTGATFQLVFLGDVTNGSGGSQRTLSLSAGATQWERPEDGAWDPTHLHDFYFATTAGPSRLWRLRFNDIENPQSGGRVDVMLDGAEGPRMMDNIAVRARGDVIIQEDPEPQRLAKIWRYDPYTDTVDLIAEHDPVRFAGAPEESSGVIDVSDILGDGWLLLDVQSHEFIPGDISQGGQLLAMHLPTPRRRSARH